jgi:hypothetical protein
LQTVPVGIYRGDDHQDATALGWLSNPALEVALLNGTLRPGQYEIVGHRLLPDVFLNSFTNPVLFTEGDTVEIEVTAAQKEGNLPIECSDHGPDMSDDGI